MGALMDRWVRSISNAHYTLRNASTSCPTRGNVAGMSHRQKSFVALELCQKQVLNLEVGNSAGQLLCSCGISLRSATAKNSFAKRGAWLLVSSRSNVFGVNFRINPLKFSYKDNESCNSSKLKVYAQKQTVEEAAVYFLEDLEMDDDAKSPRKSNKSRSSKSGASSVSSGVRLEHISKTFKGLQVLKDVSWEVKKGERVGLVGVNGAGACLI